MNLDQLGVGWVPIRPISYKFKDDYEASLVNWCLFKLINILRLILFIYSFIESYSHIYLYVCSGPHRLKQFLSAKLTLIVMIKLRE